MSRGTRLLQQNMIYHVVIVVIVELALYRVGWVQNDVDPIEYFYSFLIYYTHTYTIALS